jgi:ribosomal protein S18 acetylase RimI-like enzyme
VPPEAGPGVGLRLRARLASVSTRVRRATEQDIDLISWVMLAASRSHLERGIWEYLNDHDEAASLAFLQHIATTKTVHLFHHSLFLVAELDGTPGAAMCAYDSSLQGFEAFGAEMGPASIAHGVDLQDAEYARRLGVMLGGFVTDFDGPTGPRWVIENVATRPEARRRGLVDALLHQLLGAGRERGFEHAQIGVYIGNERARRAYTKAGFEVVAEQRSDEWEREIGCPGTELLLQPLH